MLALARHTGATAQTPADCTPFLYESQRFVNASGAPSDPATTIGTAFEKNCRTALARASRSLTPDQLHLAAADLGIGVPSATGASAYDGLVPATADPLGLVQNALGEGSVLTSPLAMARASATVASGTQRASTLVTPTTRTTPDPAPKILDSTEQALLQQLMLGSVTSDEQLAPLRAPALGRVSAIAGMAGYGPADTAPVHAWCTGYQGTIAFAVLVTGEPGKAPTGLYPALHAAEIAAAFLG
jgi:cell division protein FtsI/penicillin-binding protein 2